MTPKRLIDFEEGYSFKAKIERTEDGWVIATSPELIHGYALENFVDEYNDFDEISKMIGKDVEVVVKKSWSYVGPLHQDLTLNRPTPKTHLVYLGPWPSWRK